MAGKRTVLTPRQALEQLDRRREAQRLANATGRLVDRQRGLTLIQVKAPDSSRHLLRQIAAALCAGDYQAREIAADALMNWQPPLTHQETML